MSIKKIIYWFRRMFCPGNNYIDYDYEDSYKLLDEDQFRNYTMNMSGSSPDLSLYDQF